MSDYGTNEEKAKMQSGIFVPSGLCEGCSYSVEMSARRLFGFDAELRENCCGQFYIRAGSDRQAQNVRLGMIDEQPENDGLTNVNLIPNWTFNGEPGIRLFHRYAPISLRFEPGASGRGGAFFFSRRPASVRMR